MTTRTDKKYCSRQVMSFYGVDTQSAFRLSQKTKSSEAQQEGNHNSRFRERERQRERERERERGRERAVVCLEMNS